MPITIRNLEKHQVLDIAGYRRLCHNDPLFFESICQLFLCLDDLRLNDLFDFHDSISFHSCPPQAIHKHTFMHRLKYLHK